MLCKLKKIYIFVRNIKDMSTLNEYVILKNTNKIKRVVFCEQILNKTLFYFDDSTSCEKSSILREATIDEINNFILVKLQDSYLKIFDAKSFARKTKEYFDKMGV